MAPCLSKLPSLCLEAIFKHLPLSDLFYSIGFVCTSWYNSRRTELIRRRRLVLLCHRDVNHHRVNSSPHATELIERVRRDDGSPWHTFESLEQIKFDTLVCDMRAILFIASLNLSNITRLHLDQTFTNSNLSQVIRLIENSSQNLVDLKIIAFFQDRVIDVDNNNTATREHTINVSNLIDCINRLPSLRYLNLDLSNLIFRPQLLSCMSRLNTFAVRVNGNISIDGWIYDSINQYARNETTSIEIYNMEDIQTMLLQFDYQLANKFNVLNVRLRNWFEPIVQQYNDMRQFCTRFISLTKLAMRSNTLPMTMLARCLSLLLQLVHFDLRFDRIPQLEEEGQQITQVPSVRLLSIRLHTTESHHDTERLFIAEIFPNVQVLRFAHTFAQCQDCEIPFPRARNDFGGIRGIDPEQAHRIAECKRLTRQPFRRCAHLHTFAYVVSGKETLINLDDL